MGGEELGREQNIKEKNNGEVFPGIQRKEMDPCWYPRAWYTQHIQKVLIK